MRGGSIVDVRIIAVPSSRKNAAGERDPEMHQTTKGNQWFIRLKAHIGVDAGTGCTHTVSVTAADVHDSDQAAILVRADDQVAYAAPGFLGAHH